MDDWRDTRVDDARAERSRNEVLGALCGKAAVAAPFIGWTLNKFAGLGRYLPPGETLSPTEMQTARLVTIFALLFYIAALPCAVIAIRNLPRGHASRKWVLWGGAIGAMAAVFFAVLSGPALFGKNSTIAFGVVVQTTSSEPPAPVKPTPPADPKLVAEARRIADQKLEAEHAKFLAAAEAFEKADVLNLTNVVRRDELELRFQLHVAKFTSAAHTWRYTPGKAVGWFQEELRERGLEFQATANEIRDYAQTNHAYARREEKICDAYGEITIRYQWIMGNLRSSWTPGQFKPGTTLPKISDPVLDDKMTTWFSELAEYREKLAVVKEKSAKASQVAAATPK